MTEHTRISLVKSLVRIGALISLLLFDVRFGITILVYAEVIGILEEV